MICVKGDEITYDQKPDRRTLRSNLDRPIQPEFDWTVLLGIVGPYDVDWIVADRDSCLRKRTSFLLTRGTINVTQYLRLERDFRIIFLETTVNSQKVAIFTN
jgi:hypothetical protein